MKYSCPYCASSLSNYTDKYICDNCNAMFKLVKGKLKVIREEY